MLWIDAARMSAEVIEGQAIVYRPDQEFIANAVCEPLTPTHIGLDVEVAVAVRADSTLPEPAALAAIELALEASPYVGRPRPAVASHARHHTTVYTEHIGGFLLDHLKAVA